MSRSRAPSRWAGLGLGMIAIAVLHWGLVQARPAGQPAPAGPPAASPPAPGMTAASDARLRLLDLFPSAGGPVSHGPAPRGLSGVGVEDCAPCHAEIAAEWASSAHARSWTDVIFQAEYKLTPEPFCRRCHAPLVQEPAGEDSASRARADTLARRGIDCAVCHVRGGRVLGVRGRGDSDHAAASDARLATSAFCGSCHQFNFPAPEPGRRPRYHPGRPLQNTLREWEQSRHSDKPCQACHMPRTAGERSSADRPRAHRDHAFRTFEDRAFMASAVTVKASARRRGDKIEVTVTVMPGAIGHAFPTGDMFREAVLTIRLGDQQHTELLRRDFALTITDDARGHLLGEVEDTRVPARAARPWRRRVVFAAPAGAAPQPTAVDWSLELHRLPLDDARERGLPESLVRVPVSSGTARLPGR